MLDEYKRLMEERRLAEEEKRLAEEEMQRTEDNMNATIAASWKQGSDTQGRNYYYNFVTGESRWEPPTEWKMKPVDTWIRQKDERGQIYYYNQQSGESRWLPPCCICDKEGEKWCTDCCAAYCAEDFDELHGEEADEIMKTHAWSAVEYEKDVLKPGEVFCLECKRKRCTVMCTTCWDPYCDDCFGYVHHAGQLRSHKKMRYDRAKKGWMCVKSRMEGEKDYYVNGTSGETTFEKPLELMTEDERIYYKNFVAHKEEVEKNVAKITQLQFDLEAVSYEKDTILFDQLKNQGAEKEKRHGKVKKGADSKQAASEVIMNALKGPSSFFSSMINGTKDPGYRSQILKPDDRSRGRHRTEMIQGLLEAAPTSTVMNQKSLALTKKT